VAVPCLFGIRLVRSPLRCPGQSQSGIALFDDAIRICDRCVIAVAWIGRNLQPGGAGSPLGVPIVNVSNKALREAMTFLAERAGTEFERLLLAEADRWLDTCPASSSPSTN